MGDARALAGPVAGLAGGLLRLGSAALIVAFLTGKLAALHPLGFLAALWLALALLPPPSLLLRVYGADPWPGRPAGALYRALFGPKLWLQRRGFALRWAGRGLFCAAMAALWLPLFPRAPEVPPEARSLLGDPERPGAYDAAVGPTGDVVYVTHARDEEKGRNGVSRIDLATGEVVTHPYEDPNGFYLELFPAADRLVVNTSRAVEGHPSGFGWLGHLYQFRPDTLERLPDIACPRPYAIRSYRLADGAILQVGKNTNVLTRSRDLSDPCGPTSVEFPVGPPLLARSLRPRILALEHLTFLDDAPQLAWATGEVGGLGCLVDVELSRVERCIWFGLFVWSTALEPGTGRLWVSRPAHHRVDVRDGRSGALLDSFPVASVPRSVVFDPRGGLGFVGLYATGEILLVDTRSLAITGRVGAGERLRRLVVNEARDELLAVSAESLLAFPLASLRERARSAAP